MALALTSKVVLGTIAFSMFWFLAVFPSIPLLPIGRTAGSLVGAMLMVVFQVITPREAYSSIDLSILGLLFGTMVVVIYLERADMFKYLGKLVSWKCQGPKDLLIRVSLVSAISSALFTNDTACIALTDFILEISMKHNVSPLPLLLALSSSANIGSAATPIGNPQNLVITIRSGINFMDFLLGILPATVVGVAVNTLLLNGMYWKVLDQGFKDHCDDEEGGATCPIVVSHHEDKYQSWWTRREEVGNKYLPWREVLWKRCVYLITFVMLIGLLLGFDMSWTTITAALALVVLDFTDADPSLEKVSYLLLIFFCGMFIVVEGFQATGIPGEIWELTKPYAMVTTPSGIVVFSLLVLVLCNLVSNVPTVMLLGAKVAASAAAISAPDEKKAWMILAWVSTVAGNLTLFGSAANLIVSEQARRSSTNSLHCDISFWNHLIFGFPSTLIVTAIGLTLISG